MIEAIKKTIHENYWLDREDRDWFLDDNVKLHAPHRHSVAFSLDNRKKPPFGFLGGNPPAGVAKMCDAIVALFDGGKLYVFIVEQKTQNLDEHEKQLANGKFFCDWLFSLYREYGHCNEEPVYIGLLVWRPRERPGIGQMTHRIGETRKHKLFADFFEIRNKPDISLWDIVKACGGKV